jgi:uncharacterized protein YggU (UPF0235/DUF167 family)
LSTSPEITIQVKVKPNARTSLLEETSTGVWLAQVKSQAIGGKANNELIALIAEHFGCSKSAVSIKRGASARIKFIRVQTSR